MSEYREFLINSVMDFCERHEDTLINIVLPIVYSLIIIVIVSWFVLWLVPRFEANLAQQRETTIQACIRAYDYTYERCAFMVDHPRVGR